MAAGDVDAAARLVERLWLPADRQGRVATLQRWFRWLEDRGGIEGHPMLAVLAAFVAALTGRPAEAERWADVVDRWQYQDAARPDDPAAEAWAAVLRAMLCRDGVEQMRADADEAVRRCAAAGIVAPTVPLCQGSRASCAVTSTAATRSSRTPSAIGDSRRARVSRDRAVRAVAGGDGTRSNGARPRPSPARHARVLRRAGIEEARDASALRGASPGRPAPGRRRGGAPGARQCSAAAALADLRDAPPGRPGPDRAHPRPPRARRPGRGQDADAGDR